MHRGWINLYAFPDKGENQWEIILNDSSLFLNGESIFNQKSRSTSVNIHEHTQVKGKEASFGEELKDKKLPTCMTLVHFLTGSSQSRLKDSQTINKTLAN